MLLTLQTFGTLQASTTDSAGHTRVLGRGKPVAMLAYLACIPGHRASREHLAALLWGDVESDAARQNLRQAIWYLKKKLGDGLLDASEELLALSAPFTCDRDAFLHAAHQADFAGAVQRHRGTFIPDFAAPGASEFEQWCELERRRLTVTFLRCADALARRWLSEGKFRDAQDLARRARDVDPMDQSTWRLLLEALVAGSDGLGAASEAEHFEAFLAREEQEPEAASRAAMRAARRSPSVRLSGDAGPQASIAAELVGREAEFSRVLAAWDEARTGTPHVLCVAAPAGMGKSRLLRDLQARLRASRARCVLVRANPGDRNLTGGFAAEVASQLALLTGAAAVSPGSAGVLVALAPALESLYPSAVRDHSAGEEAVRRRAFALVDLARAVSDEQPVALLLDDLHWADEQSTRVIAGALSRLEHIRVLVVMTKRNTPDPRGLFSPFERLDLPPLDLAAVTSFVAQVAELPTASWADLLPQQLLLATGGSPLLLVETLHDALEQGWLTCSATGEWQCDDAARITTSLREGSAVRQRVLRLSPDARHALLALSIVGRPIDIADAVAMMGGRPVAMDEPLEALERGGFVARNGSQVMVAHDEIADAVLAASTDEERRRIHAGIARHLLATAADEAGLRRSAEHAAAAGEDAVAVRVWREFFKRRRRGGDRRATGQIAADLLGRDVADAEVRSLVSATPLWLRQRVRWAVAAGIGILLVSVATASWARWTSAPASVFAVWNLDRDTGTGRLVGVKVRTDAPWLAGVPLEATELDSNEFPIAAPNLRDRQLTLSPDGRYWWGNGTLGDMGEEGVLVDASGRERLPLRHTGDDGILDFSPDGRQIVGYSARYDTLTDHAQIVTLDAAGGALHRLTHSGEYDADAFWRPDGTQIAFTRRFYSQTRVSKSLCLIDVDGGHERCLTFAMDVGGGNLGWLDNRRLLVGREDGSVIALDVERNDTTRLSTPFFASVFSHGAIRACLCRPSLDAPASLYLVPAGDVGAARPVLYRGKPLTGTLRIAASRVWERTWLEELRIVATTGNFSLENVHRIAVEGHLANGAAAELHDLRWTSRDTSVATIDSLGRLRPRRVGDTWVVVTAGGWRTDSVLAHITPPTSATLLHERWDAAWLTRWRPFGDPAGTVITTDRGAAFLPNGDGSYPSGAYTRTAMSANRGFGLEADVYLTLRTPAQWQTLVIDILAGNAAKMFGEWDHRTSAGLPVSRSWCSIAFPGVEGAAGFAFPSMTLGGRTAVRVTLARGFFSGQWHRVRFQLFEDNRCAVAIDGVPRAITPAIERRPTSELSLWIGGDDRFGGRLVVGKLEAWSGVRGGVDWTQLDADVRRKKP